MMPNAVGRPQETSQVDTLAAPARAQPALWNTPRKGLPPAEAPRERRADAPGRAVADSLAPDRLDAGRSSASAMRSRWPAGWRPRRFRSPASRRRR
jgi:hypothetical protein